MTSTTNTSTTTTEAPCPQGAGTVNVDIEGGIDWSPDLRTDPALCPPWCCSAGEGHWPAGAPLECWSEDFEKVTLTTGEPVVLDSFEQGSEDVKVADYVSAYLWKSEDEPVTIHVSHRDRPGMSFTLAEVDQFVAVLVKLKEIGEQ